jgi:acid phosphatase (class A)
MKALLALALLAAAPLAAQAPLPPPTFIAPADVDLPRALPAFPEPGSLASRADIETMLSLQMRRTPVDESDAQADSVTTMSDWTRLLLGTDATPALLDLSAKLHDDMRGINRAANAAKGFRPRPKEFDARIKPSLDMIGHGNASYPSARTSSGYVWARMIAEVRPAKAQSALEMAERIAWRRVVGGVHYPSDLAGSRIVADAVWAKLSANPAFRDALNAAR